MKKVFEIIGLDDGEGHISLGRVVVLITVVTVMLPHVIAACKGEMLAWSPDDWKILGIAFGGKVAQSFAENSTPSNPAA
jgi:hypothetical protein